MDDIRVSAEPEPDPRERKKPAWSRASKLMLEAGLIVLSVLMGFALNEWQQTRADRRLTETVLANFRREIEANLDTLQRTQPRHRLITERLAAAAARPHGDSTAFDVFASLLPRDGLGLQPLQETAWATANSTGAFRLLDYPTAARISETYVVQRSIVAASTQRLFDHLYSRDNFDPAAQRSMLLTEHMLMNEVSSEETYLIDVYRATLRQLPTNGRPDSTHTRR
jgi:type II secretory pathway pseudopilin PulG